MRAKKACANREGSSVVCGIVVDWTTKLYLHLTARNTAKTTRAVTDTAWSWLTNCAKQWLTLDDEQKRQHHQHQHDHARAACALVSTPQPVVDVSALWVSFTSWMFAVRGNRPWWTQPWYVDMHMCKKTYMTLRYIAFDGIALQQYVCINKYKISL